MGVPMHLVVLLKELYTSQVATVRTEFGETNAIAIGRGVQQGCILSPVLFNSYAENIMREALINWNGGVKIGGQRIANLRYADDTTLLSRTEAELTELLKRVMIESEKAGLYLNITKPRWWPVERWALSSWMEMVGSFQFLGVFITSDASCAKEIKRRIAMGRSAMGRLWKLWKDREISIKTKLKLVQTLVFPIVIYDAETWTFQKDLRKRIDAFELWCWRRALRIPWTAKKKNEWLISTIKAQWTLESRVAKATLSYFGHVMRAEGGMEREVMMRQMEGKRRRGRPRRRWMNGVRELTAEGGGTRREVEDGERSPPWSPGSDSTRRNIVTLWWFWSGLVSSDENTSCNLKRYLILNDDISHSFLDVCIFLTLL